jgi:hypothetical protein
MIGGKRVCGKKSVYLVSDELPLRGKSSLVLPNRGCQYQQAEVRIHWKIGGFWPTGAKANVRQKRE